MDIAMRALLMPDPADAGEQARAGRLCRGDVQALMELYDEVSATAYSWALALTRSKRVAMRILRQVFTRAAEQPSVFCDRRVSSRGWILLEVQRLAHAVRGRRPARTGRHRSARVAPVPG